MILTNLIMLGDSDSGKTRLIQRIAPDQFPFNRDLKDGASDIAYTFHVAKNEGPKYDFLCADTACRSNSTWTKETIKGVTITKDYILYCVDLSKPIEMADMAKLNDLFKEIQATTLASMFRAQSQSIILVGTKSDINTSPNSVATFKNYEFDSACNVVPTRYITSSQSGDGIEELKNGLYDQVQNKHWNTAVAELRSALQNRGLIYFSAINQNLTILKAELDNGNADFDTFVTDSKNFLQETLPAFLVPPLMETIYTFTYHLIWTIFAATLVGFTIGFMMGIWSGPGAFVTGVLGASAAAQNTMITAGLMGMIKGGYETQMLFRPARRAQEDIHNFAWDIAHPTTSIWEKAYDSISRCGM